MTIPEDAPVQPISINLADAPVEELVQEQVPAPEAAQGEPVAAEAQLSYNPQDARKK